MQSCLNEFDGRHVSGCTEEIGGAVATETEGPDENQGGCLFIMMWIMSKLLFALVI